MAKRFNVTGICIPEKHYMVDISGKIDTIIEEYIEEGNYFTINCARQYGKTTTLYMLEQSLKRNYLVIQSSFESADDLFVSRYTFAVGLVRRIGRILKWMDVDSEILEKWNQPVSEEFPFDDLSDKITSLCGNSEKEVILMIDEVDKSSDNQIFLAFLGLLRNKYLEQQKKRDHTFKSVILAGVYDIKNLKLKLRPEEEKKYNSPWNVAVDFAVNMNFSPEEISTMLWDYERDYHTGMNVGEISRLIYDYTSGYPYLVSRVCQLADERVAGTKHFPGKKDVWTAEGIRASEALLRKESNTLFDDMMKQLVDYPKLRQLIQGILFNGSRYSFERENHLISLGSALGFLKENNGVVAVSNRIFETKLYDLFTLDGKQIFEAIV